MKNLIQRWTQSGTFFQKYFHFFRFSTPLPTQLRTSTGFIILGNSGLGNFVDVQHLHFFLTQFIYTLFIKTPLLFCISLFKSFIFRRFDTFRFSLMQQFLSRLLRTWSRRYLLISSGKISTACPQEKSSLKKNHADLTDLEYFTCLLKTRITEWKFIGLQNVWLLSVNIFSNLRGGSRLHPLMQALKSHLQW